MTSSLTNLLAAFDQWAPTHPQNDEGWESYFPDFPALIAAAAEAMRHADPNDTEQLKQIARVWSFSEEAEDLTHIVESDPAPYARILPALIPHADWRARFQIYSIAPRVPGLGVPFLLQGLNANDHPYVLRRILLALRDADPEAAYRVARQFVSSDDEYLSDLAQKFSALLAP